MADTFIPVKNAISAGDKIVTAIQSGNKEQFWAAAKDGLLAPKRKG